MFPSEVQLLTVVLVAVSCHSVSAVLADRTGTGRRESLPGASTNFTQGRGTISSPIIRVIPADHNFGRIASNLTTSLGNSRDFAVNSKGLLLVMTEPEKIGGEGTNMSLIPTFSVPPSATLDGLSESVYKEEVKMDEVLGRLSSFDNVKPKNKETDDHLSSKSTVTTTYLANKGTTMKNHGKSSTENGMNRLAGRTIPYGVYSTMKNEHHFVNSDKTTIKPPENHEMVNDKVTILEDLNLNRFNKSFQELKMVIANTTMSEQNLANQSQQEFNIVMGTTKMNEENMSNDSFTTIEDHEMFARESPSWSPLERGIEVITDNGTAIEDVAFFNHSFYAMFERLEERESNITDSTSPRNSVHKVREMAVYVVIICGVIVLGYAM